MQIGLHPAEALPGGVEVLENLRSLCGGSLYGEGERCHFNLRRDHGKVHGIIHVISVTLGLVTIFRCYTSHQLWSST